MRDSNRPRSPTRGTRHAARGPRTADRGAARRSAFLGWLTCVGSVLQTCGSSQRDVHMDSTACEFGAPATTFSRGRDGRRAPVPTTRLPCLARGRTRMVFYLSSTLISREESRKNQYATSEPDQARRSSPVCCDTARARQLQRFRPVAFTHPDVVFN